VPLARSEVIRALRFFPFYIGDTDLFSTEASLRRGAKHNTRVASYRNVRFRVAENFNSAREELRTW
jgi:hypothetical protein